MPISKYIRTISWFFIVSVLLTCTLIAQAGELTLAVANSTCTAIKKVGDLYKEQNEIDLNYICKSSGRLAKGLNGDAIMADIYISANRKWMDYMIDSGKVDSRDVVSTWGNELVVAAPSVSSINDFEWNDLTTDKIKRILIGDPGTAPFGRYAKQALTSTDLWESVRNKISTKKHITLLAESLAESDTNTVGILFLSNVNNKLRVLYPIDKTLHSPIRYYMAPLVNSNVNNQVNSLLAFIQSDVAREVFTGEGFKLENH